MFAAFTLSLSLGLVPAASDWGPLVEALPCSEKVQAALSSWDALPEAFRAPSGLDGADRFRIPTTKLGVWITLESAASGHVRLFRNTAASGVAWELDASCQVSKRDLPGLTAATNGHSITDLDLERLVQANDRVVIYLWTPHLPLSVEGYHEIARATASTSAMLVAVVDPSADPEYVREVADAEGIPTDARRRVASIELLFRNLAVHAPAVLVFDEGRAHPVLPGYRSAKAYAEYLSGLER